MVLTWLRTHWELVALVAGVLISILNAATTHWSEHKGLVKVLLWVVDCLSLIRSKGTEGEVLGNAKLPGPTGASGIIKVLVPLLLAGSLLSGCICSTPRACLVTAHKALDLADKPALKIIGDKCMAEASKCVGVPADKCDGWVKCDKARAAYKAAMDGLDGSLATCNRVLYTLGVK